MVTAPGAPNDILHRASEIACPISRRLLEKIRNGEIVLADETPMRMQDDGYGKLKTGFVWTFVARDEHGGEDLAFLYAANRSGETPPSSAWRHEEHAVGLYSGSWSRSPRGISPSAYLGRRYRSRAGHPAQRLELLPSAWAQSNAA